MDLGIKTIARRLGMARNMVRAALAAHEPPKHERRTVGSSVDAFEPAIRDLLGGFPDMPATVIAERVAWTGSSSVLRARVGWLRPPFRGAGPADRTVYAAGEIVQCDRWFPAKVIPDGAGTLLAPPMLTTVEASSRFLIAVMLPTRTSGDQLAGMWQLLATNLGASPKTFSLGHGAGIGQHCAMSSSRSPQDKHSEVVDGVTIKYHASGKTVWSKGRVENGQPEGYWEWYRIDGTLKRSGRFRLGEPVGAWTTYDAKGQPYKTTQR